jgi:hypothetical protein
MHRVQPIENIDSVKLRANFVKLRVRLIVVLVVAPQPVSGSPGRHTTGWHKT